MTKSNNTPPGGGQPPIDLLHERLLRGAPIPDIVSKWRAPVVKGDALDIARWNNSRDLKNEDSRLRGLVPGILLSTKSRTAVRDRFFRLSREACFREAVAAFVDMQWADYSIAVIYSGLVVEDFRTWLKSRLLDEWDLFVIGPRPRYIEEVAQVLRLSLGLPRFLPIRGRA